MDSNKQKRGPGRPRLTEGPVTEVRVRITHPDLRLAEERAAKDGVSRSEWIRQTVSKAVRPEWQPTDEDGRLLHEDYRRLGIEPGTEDAQLVATIVSFVRRPGRARS